MILPKPYYQDEWATIYHGDCREILPHINTVDLLLTDPPYGINADAEASKNKGKWGWKYYGQTSWDMFRPPGWLIQQMVDRAKSSIIWGGHYFTDILPPTQCWLVWDKGQRDFSLADFEAAWTSYDKASRIITVARGKALTDGKCHPTQKSIEVMKWCIAKISDRYDKDPPNIILDPFMGSGTTLRAAKDLNRKSIGIDIEEKYCEIASNRLRQEVFNFQ